MRSKPSENCGTISCNNHPSGKSSDRSVNNNNDINNNVSINKIINVSNNKIRNNNINNNNTSSNNISDNDNTNNYIISNNNNKTNNNNNDNIGNIINNFFKLQLFISIIQIMLVHFSNEACTHIQKHYSQLWA